MSISQQPFRGTAMLALLLLAAGPRLLTPHVHADEPKKARSAKPTVALFAGGADEDLKVLRETLAKIVGVKFKADDLKFGDFKREGGLVTGFLPLEVTDLGKADIGAVARAVSSADTSRKDKCPPALFLILRYKPDSIKTDQLRTALAKVKGVQPEKSWAGDANLWVSVDGSGQAKLVEITRALHDAGVKFRDPTIDAD